MRLSQRHIIHYLPYVFPCIIFRFARYFPDAMCMHALETLHIDSVRLAHFNICTMARNDVDEFVNENLTARCIAKEISAIRIYDWCIYRLHGSLQCEVITNKLIHHVKGQRRKSKRNFVIYPINEFDRNKKYLFILFATRSWKSFWIWWY